MPRWQKNATVVEQSCVPSANVTIYTWVYLHSPPVSPSFLQIFLLHMSRCWKVWEIRAFVENRGDIFAITIMWLSQGSRFRPLYHFPSLMYGRRQTDSSMLEPLIHASVPQCSVWVAISLSAEMYGHKGNRKIAKMVTDTGRVSVGELSEDAHLYLGRQSGINGAGVGDAWDLRHWPRLMLHNHVLVI